MGELDPYRADAAKLAPVLDRCFVDQRRHGVKTLAAQLISTATSVAFAAWLGWVTVWIAAALFGLMQVTVALLTVLKVMPHQRAVWGQLRTGEAWLVWVHAEPLEVYSSRGDSLRLAASKASAGALLEAVQSLRVRPLITRTAEERTAQRQRFDFEVKLLQLASTFRTSPEAEVCALFQRFSLWCDAIRTAAASDPSLRERAKASLDRLEVLLIGTRNSPGRNYFGDEIRLHLGKLEDLLQHGGDARVEAAD